MSTDFSYSFSLLVVSCTFTFILHGFCNKYIVLVMFFVIHYNFSISSWIFLYFLARYWADRDTQLQLLSICVGKRQDEGCGSSITVSETAFTGSRDDSDHIVLPAEPIRDWAVITWPCVYETCIDLQLALL